MIEARRFDLFDDPMPSLNDLEGYLGETAAAIIQMSALILDQRSAPACAEVAGLAGVAMGIVGLMRLLPLHRARGQCYVPADLLAPDRLAAADVIAGQPEDRLNAVLCALQKVASRYLQEARGKRSAIASEVFPAFLPAALTETYLARLRILGVTSLSRVADVSQLRRQLRLYWCARREMF
jgi:phytoene synthase